MSSARRSSPHIVGRVAARAAAGMLAAVVAASACAEDWQAAVRAEDYARARTALETALAASPENTSLRYELARVLALQGSAEAALAELDTLLARHPDNADYWLARAQLLARLGRDAAALESTQRALRLAPDYEDVWQLQLRLAERTADEATADTLRRDAATRFPDASWWRRASAPAEHARWVSVGFGTDRLSNGAPDWSREFVRLDWQTPQGASLYADVAQAGRFERSDSALEVGGAWAALPQWRLGGALAAVADAEFEAARTLSFAAQRAWSDGWGTELGLKRREYASATVSSYSFTLDKYVADYRLAYRLDYSRLQSAGSSAGHALILGWYPSERRSLGVTIGAGEEIETIGLDRLLRTRISSVTLSGRETLSGRLTLGWWLGSHEQGDFHTRRYGGLSVRIGL